MEQYDLLSAIRRIFDLACRTQSAGLPDAAADHIEELRELLNLEHADREAEAEKTQSILDGGNAH